MTAVDRIGNGAGGRRASAALALVLVVAVAAAGVLILGSNDDEPTTSRTEQGIRWSVDGSDIVITVTDSAPASVRRLLRGRVALGCRMIDSKTITVAAGTARFAQRPGTTRVRLSRPLERVDVCRLSGTSVIASVRFRDRAEQPDKTLVIP